MVEQVGFVACCDEEDTHHRELGDNPSSVYKAQSFTMASVHPKRVTFCAKRSSLPYSGRSDLQGATGIRILAVTPGPGPFYSLFRHEEDVPTLGLGHSISGHQA